VEQSWISWLPRSATLGYIAMVAAMLEHRTHGPEREGQADLYAMQLCLDAGYDGTRCLQAFDIMENLSLDMDDVSGVYGPENLLDPTDPDQGGIAYQVQRWLWTKQRGYLPLRERRQRASAYLARSVR
jgi:hypothetical protein